jgi:hypothetical protein
MTLDYGNPAGGGTDLAQRFKFLMIEKNDLLNKEVYYGRRIYGENRVC